VIADLLFVSLQGPFYQSISLSPFAY